MTVLQDGTTPTPTSEPSVVEQLVGEGKKFKTIEDALRGKVEADNHIEELKAKLAEAEAKVTKDDKLGELLKQLQEKATENVTPAPAPTPESTPQLEASDLKSLVADTVKELTQTELEAANLKLVNESLEKSFGTEAEAKFKEKINALGLSEEQAVVLAKQSPEAILSLVGSEPKEGSILPVRSSVDQASLMSSGKRNKGYYTKLRKDNPNLYYSAKVQGQMVNDRQEQGSDFYNP